MSFTGRLAARKSRVDIKHLRRQFTAEPGKSVFEAIVDDGIAPDDIIDKAEYLYNTAHACAQTGSMDTPHVIYWQPDEAEQSKPAFATTLAKLRAVSATGDWQGFCREIRGKYPPESPEGNVFRDAAIGLIAEAPQATPSPRVR